MLFLVLECMGAGFVTTDPTVSNVVVNSFDAGECSGGVLVSSASIRVSWSITNSNTLYESKVYENDILVATLPITTTVHDKTITDYVENGSHNQFTSNWVYRVDVVRKADSVVVSAAFSAAWQQLYGNCGEPQ